MNLALAPLRFKSKSIVLKNNKEFSCKPLVYCALKELQNCDLIEKIFVATDSEEINAVVNRFKFTDMFSKYQSVT